MKRHKKWRFVRASCCSEAGSSTIEYAILVGLILMILVGSSVFVVDFSFTEMNSVSDSLADHSDSAVLDSGQTPKQDSVASPKLPWWVTSLVVLGALLTILGGLRLLLGKKHQENVVEPMEDRVLNRFAENRARILAVFKSNRNEYRHWIVRAEHVMQRRLERVDEDDSRAEVLRMLNESSLGCLLVGNKNKESIGLIQATDLAAFPPTAKARDMMNDDPHCVVPTANLASVLELMHTKRLTCVPVVSDDGKVVGVVSTDDVMATLLCTLQLLSEVDHEYRKIMNRALGMSAQRGGG